MTSKLTRTHTLIAGTTLAAALATALTLPVAQAAAPSELDGLTLGKTDAAITASLAERGYQVDEIEREDGMIEAEAVKDGTEYEIHVDPETGMVEKVELDE